MEQSRDDRKMLRTTATNEKNTMLAAELAEDLIGLVRAYLK
jgi:hypothetical protein